MYRNWTGFVGMYIYISYSSCLKMTHPAEAGGAIQKTWTSGLATSEACFTASGQNSLNLAKESSLS